LEGKGLLIPVAERGEKRAYLTRICRNKLVKSIKDWGGINAVGRWVRNCRAANKTPEEGKKECGYQEERTNGPFFAVMGSSEKKY